MGFDINILKQLYGDKESKDDRAKYKLLLVILISASVGVIAMPHDTPVATIATKYIFPAVVAGFSLGIAFMASVGFWQLSKKRSICK